MEYVTLVNRTSKPLNGTWNGRQFKVLPGESTHPIRIADAIKRQNPLMGSQGSELFEVIYLCGIKELGDDIFPLEQSDSKELMDPNILHAATIAAGRKLDVVPGAAGMYRTRAAVAAELPVAGRNDVVASGFEKP